MAVKSFIEQAAGVYEIKLFGIIYTTFITFSKIMPDNRDNYAIKVLLHWPHGYETIIELNVIILNVIPTHD
jgi:hypothetical protein